MLVQITGAEDAAAAARAGADVVELVLPGARPDLSAAAAVRRVFPGTLRLRFDGLSLTTELVTAAATVHADEIALAFDHASLPMPVVDAKLPPGVVAVALVRPGPDTLESIQRVRGRAGAVMLDAGGDHRLIDEVAISFLDTFATACRSAGLRYGLAGGLEAPDVARLLLLQPDMLGFDAAVRVDHRADATLDPQALDAIRGLIPPEGTPAATPAKAEVTDRIFVRDFVLALAIGAYQAEHGSRQRVRFSVEADVVREPVPPRDMRDVFSYDVILETIRMLAQRPHVTFVETLAEEIAAALLAQGALSAVSVKVEKLDVIDGSVGIETTRRRTR